MVGHLKNVLETHDIPCNIQGEFRGILVGEIPPADCWPELWLVDRSQAEQAYDLIKKALDETEQDRPKWKCSTCDEDIEGQFTLCWKCGTDRPTST
jgi:hypothetical protein